MSRPLVAPLLVVALATWGCASRDGRSTPPSISPIVASPSTTTLAVTPAATGPGTGPCFYVWASHDLPDLSQKLQTALQATNSASSGAAYAYGEDCVYEDGHRDFSAMETDFRIRMKVVDFKDEQALGNGLAAVMSIIGELPTADLAGGRAGRVDFSFYTADSKELHLNVDIDKYHAQAAGISGAQLFRLFYVSP